MIFHVLLRQDGTIWFWKFQKNVSGSPLLADSMRNAAQNLEISTLRGDISGRSAIFNCNSKPLFRFFYAKANPHQNARRHNDFGEIF